MYKLKTICMCIDMAGSLLPYNCILKALEPFLLFRAAKARIRVQFISL